MALTTLHTIPHQNFEGVSSFICDATISVAPTFTNTITNHPVDRTSSVSDHVINSNPVIRVEGVVSNSYSQEDYLNNPDLVQIGNLIDYTSNRVQTAYNLLKALWKEGGRFQLVSEYDTFDNCLIRTFSTDFTKDTSDVLMFSLEVEQVRPATHQRVDITVLDGNLAVDAEGNTSGNKLKEKTKCSKTSAHTYLSLVELYI